MERFIRTLKGQLIWLRQIATMGELIEALHDFRKLSNENWIMQRHGYITPAAWRRQLLADAGHAA